MLPFTICWGCVTPLFDLLGCDAHLLAPGGVKLPIFGERVVAKYGGGGDHGALAPVTILMRLPFNFFRSTRIVKLRFTIPLPH